jgi:hypothetical protein
MFGTQKTSWNIAQERLGSGHNIGLGSWLPVGNLGLEPGVSREIPTGSKVPKRQVMLSAKAESAAQLETAKRTKA